MSLSGRKIMTGTREIKLQVNKKMITTKVIAITNKKRNKPGHGKLKGKQSKL